ncbi:MAG: hypothetical protein ACFFEN_12240 [Candidatus Thorarchaeota archaeon]
MNVTGDFDKILEDNLKSELEWLENEFEFLFKHKRINHCYTKQDICIGNKILDNVINLIKANENEEILNLLAATLNRIERTFPEFF